MHGRGLHLTAQSLPAVYIACVDSKRWLMLIVFFAVCLGAGGLGSFFTCQQRSRLVSQLRKPAGTPPGWVFGPVWTTLYVLMAISAWLVWREYGAEQRRRC